MQQDNSLNLSFNIEASNAFNQEPISDELDTSFITLDQEDQSRDLFSKNFELMKVKYQKMVTSFIQNGLLHGFEHSEISNTTNTTSELLSPINVHSFLLRMTELELEICKSHLDFVTVFRTICSNNVYVSFKESEDWGRLSEKTQVTTEELLFLCKEIFQNNKRNYNWSVEEDYRLIQIINYLNPLQMLKNNWVLISRLLNQNQNQLQQRSPSKCKERWENRLKSQFKRGEWSQFEDLTILNFVLLNGTKWARISRILGNRTEHGVKNRFFSLLATHTTIPIKKIKKEINYLCPSLISETIMANSFVYGNGIPVANSEDLQENWSFELPSL